MRFALAAAALLAVAALAALARAEESGGESGLVVVPDRVETWTVEQAKAWVAGKRDENFASFLYAYAKYDGKARRTLPLIEEVCSDLANTYSCATLDVSEDPSFQTEAKLTSLPALIVRTTQIEKEGGGSKSLVHVKYDGPWTKEEMVKVVRENAPRVCAIIPARFASTRFPHKMLRPIQGKPMIQNTFNSVSKASLVDGVWIATEGKELIEVATKFTDRVLQTSDKPINGMERIGEAEDALPASCRILVNVHGDEPFVDPEHINDVVRLYEQVEREGGERFRRMGAASLRKRILSQEEAWNRGIIKMVVRDDGTAQYLSRALVPHSKDGFFDPNTEYWSHINLHAFARGFAKKYRDFPSPKAQLREDVEYLRILVMGFDIVTAEVGASERDVNTDEDYNYLVQKYGA